MNALILYSLPAIGTVAGARLSEQWADAILSRLVKDPDKRSVWLPYLTALIDIALVLAALTAALMIIG